MKLVTFEIETVVGALRRVGILNNQEVVDLNAAYSCYLWEVRGIWRWKELALAEVPIEMLHFIENGTKALEAAEIALEYVKGRNPEEEGPGGELQRTVHRAGQQLEN